jgi:hypothetical protein
MIFSQPHLWHLSGLVRLPDFVLNGYFDTDLLGKFIDARSY